MLRVAVDCDGVLYDFVSTARFLLSHYRDIDPGENSSWDHIRNNVTNNDWQWLWSAGVTKYGLFRHGNCYKGAFEALRVMSRMGHQIVIVTSRPKVAVSDTLAWLSYHQIQASEIHILGPHVSKATVPACDIAVDDKPENVRDFISTGAVGLLWDRPWNREATDLRRISGWDEVLSAVESAELLSAVSAIS